MAARLQELYETKIKKDMVAKFGYTNPMQVPKLVKISINMGVGEAASESKAIDSAVNEMALITGRKPQIRKSRKSIAAFKLRENLPIGCRVTLRRAGMYEFMDRLVNIALPRVRDFRGLSNKGFDGNGNYSMGLKEQIVFPEVNYDKIEKIRGMDITFVTTAKTDEEAEALLTAFNMPYVK